MSKRTTLLVCLAVAAFAFFSCGEDAGSGDGKNESEDETPESIADVVISVDGQIETIDEPVSVVPGETESDNIMLFGERFNYALPADLTVEATEAGFYDSTASLQESTIAAGTTVHSVYVHIDHPESGRLEKTGTVSFNREIAGVIATSSANVSANEVLAVSELPIEYPTSSGSLFGLELDSEPDTFEINDDRKSLTLDVSTGSKSDSTRVIFVEE